MPSAASRPCRSRWCPNLAVSDRGWCSLHDPGPWADRSPMPPGWDRVRARVMRRDQGLCQVCGAPATEVDHITPRAEGGTEDLDNLRALCRECHRRRGRRGA